MTSPSETTSAMFLLTVASVLRTAAKIHCYDFLITDVCAHRIARNKQIARHDLSSSHINEDFELYHQKHASESVVQ